MFVSLTAITMEYGEYFVFQEDGIQYMADICLCPVESKLASLGPCSTPHHPFISPTHGENNPRGDQPRCRH